MIEGFNEYLGRYTTLCKEDEAMLAELLEVRRFERKVRLIDTGEVEQYLNYVVKGMVLKYFLKGREKIIKHIAKEKSLMVSSASFFHGEPSKCIIETLETSIVISISKTNLEKLFQSGEKWEKVGRLMMADLMIEKEYWLLDMVRFSPRERLVRFIKEQPDLIQRVPQKYLASYLDIKPETFSRLKNNISRGNLSVA